MGTQPDRQASSRSAAAVRSATTAATAVDYLVSVSDLTRHGNLRFSNLDGGPYLDPDHAVPKLVSLPRLLQAADELDSATADDLAAAKALLDAGSGSLGGARPKASVRADHVALLIAKFPHREDDWDVMAWEKTVLDLADDASLETPVRRLTKVGGRSVLLLDRFDRSPGSGGSGAVRVGYVSAMTLVGAHDGDERDYLDIVDAISDHGARVNADLEELFRRVVFSIAIHNTDDHLRNHGFVRAPGGWVLSPVFDVNPQPDLGRRRSTSIAGADEVDEEPEALLALATECRVSKTRAVEVVAEVCASVERWREVAGRNGIGEEEHDVFGDAFGHQLERLRRVAG